MSGVSGTQLRGLDAPRVLGGWFYNNVQEIRGSGQGIEDYNTRLGLDPASRTTLPRTTDAGRTFIDPNGIIYKNQIWEMPHDTDLLNLMTGFDHVKQTGDDLTVITRRIEGTAWVDNMDPRQPAMVPLVKEFRRTYRFKLAHGNMKMPTNFDWFAPDDLYNEFFRKLMEQLQSSWTRLVERSTREEYKKSVPTYRELGRNDNMTEEEYQKKVVEYFGALNKCDHKDVWKTLPSTIMAEFKAMVARMNVPYPDDLLALFIPQAPFVDTGLAPIYRTQAGEFLNVEWPVDVLDMKIQLPFLRTLRRIVMTKAPKSGSVIVNIGGSPAALGVYGDLLKDAGQADPWNYEKKMLFYVPLKKGTRSVILPGSDGSAVEYTSSDIMRASGMWPGDDDGGDDDGGDDHNSDPRLFYNCCNPNKRFVNPRVGRSFAFSDLVEKSSGLKFGTCIAGSPCVVGSAEATRYFSELADLLINKYGVDTANRFAEFVNRYDHTLGSQDEVSKTHHATTHLLDVFRMFCGEHSLLTTSGDEIYYDSRKLADLSRHHGHVNQNMRTNPTGTHYDTSLLEGGTVNTMAVNDMKHAINLANSVDRSGLALRKSRKYNSNTWLGPAFKALSRDLPELTVGCVDREGRVIMKNCEAVYEKMKTVQFWDSMLLSSFGGDAFSNIRNSAKDVFRLNTLKLRDSYSTMEDAPSRHRELSDEDGVINTVVQLMNYSIPLVKEYNNSRTTAERKGQLRDHFNKYGMDLRDSITQDDEMLFSLNLVSRDDAEYERLIREYTITAALSESEEKNRKLDGARKEIIDNTVVLYFKRWADSYRAHAARLGVFGECIVESIKLAVRRSIKHGVLNAFKTCFGKNQRLDSFFMEIDAIAEAKSTDGVFDSSRAFGVIEHLRSKLKSIITNAGDHLDPSMFNQIEFFGVDPYATVTGLPGTVFDLSKIGVRGSLIDSPFNDGFRQILSRIYFNGVDPSHCKDAIDGVISQYIQPDCFGQRYLTPETISVLVLGTGDNSCGMSIDRRSEMLIGNFLNRSAAEIVNRDDIYLTRWMVTFMLGRLPPTKGVFEMLSSVNPGIWYDAVMVHVINVWTKPAFLTPRQPVRTMVSELKIRDAEHNTDFCDTDAVYGFMRYTSVNFDQVGIQFPDAYVKSFQRPGKLVTPKEFFSGEQPSGVTGFVLIDDGDGPKNLLRTLVLSRDEDLGEHVKSAEDARLYSLGGKDYNLHLSRKDEGFYHFSGMMPLEAIVADKSLRGTTHYVGCNSSKFI